MAKCMIEGCEGGHKSRGLCINCYQAARNMVAAKKTTWDKLVACGYAKEATKVSRGKGRYCTLVSGDPRIADDGATVDVASLINSSVEK